MFVPAVFVLAGLVLITIAVQRVPALSQRSSGFADSVVNGARSGDAAIDVVIPARNEAEVLPGLLADLRAQTLAPRRVLVVDDDSDDDTGSVARSGGADVVGSGARPDGWNPKVWAMHVGVQTLGEVRGETTAATAALNARVFEPGGAPDDFSGRLLFLDADVRLAPDALAALASAAESAGGLVSVAPFHCRLDTNDVPVALGAVESLSAPFNITIDAGGGPGVVGRARGAVGSCLTISYADYLRSGGHAATPNTIVDDLSLAATARASGLAVTLLQSRPVGGAGTVGCARPAVVVRSYPAGFGSMARGWIKNLSAGMGMTPPLSAIAVAWWAAALVMPVAMAARAEWVAAIGLWVVVGAHTWWLARRVGRFDPVVTSFGAPLLGLWFAAVSAASVFARLTRRTVTWKGRALRPDGVERC